MTKTKQKSTRAAFSLIELLLVITIGLILMGVLSAGLLRLMAENDSGREHLAQSLALARLAEQFSADAAAAEKADAQDDGRLTLQKSDGFQVKYHIDDDGVVVRAVSEGNDVRERESFAAGQFVGVRFEIEAAMPLAIVRLVLERRVVTGVDLPAPPAKPLHLEATAGRDRRLAKGAAP